MKICRLAVQIVPVDAEFDTNWAVKRYFLGAHSIPLGTSFNTFGIPIQYLLVLEILPLVFLGFLYACLSDKYKKCKILRIFAVSAASES